MHAQEVELSELDLPGCAVEAHAEPHALLDGFFYVSGAIPRVTPFETGLPGHITQMQVRAARPGKVPAPKWSKKP